MIIRQSIQQTTGTSNDVVQAFYQNIFVRYTEVSITPAIFDVPEYTTLGGTTDYYGQDPKAIFTNLVKPFIRFNFSENTSSFGNNVKIIHDIYRVDWENFKMATGRFKVEGEENVQNQNTITETIEETDDSGNVSRKTITRNITETKNTVRSKDSSIGGDSCDVNSEGQTIDTSAPMVDDANIFDSMKDSYRATIQDQLSEPIYTITADTTGITTSVYDFQPDQYIKNLGDFKTELFQDRAQYFVDTRFEFKFATPELSNFITINDNGDVVDGTYSAIKTGTTETTGGTIDRGEFEGISFKGDDYFTYFTVPDKPTFEYPTPEGQIDTFTPEIYWTNGENDIDEYLVQVTYNTGDTAFTGSVFSYVVPRCDELKEEATNISKNSTNDFETTKTIRKYQLSLKSNSCALYRVGNVKTITNIFGVKQNVVTFSDHKQICTQIEPIRSYVFVENDSPYVEGIAGLTSPPSLIAENPLGEYVLSGTVSGSTIEGATMQLIYPNGSFVTTLTDSGGTFSFDSLEDGEYTLNTTYRGYASDSRTINITEDTGVFIEIEIRWDNEFDIWAVKENDIIKY